MKGWIFGSVVVVLTVLGGVVYFQHEQKAKAATAAFAPDVTISPAIRGDITQTVTSPGTVASNLDVVIKCQAGGEITKLPFQEGDQVKTGDLLVQLDPQLEQRAKDLADIKLDQDNSVLLNAQMLEEEAELNLQTSTEQAAANIISAEVKARNLRLAANREKELLTEKLASDQDFETADTSAAQAEADLATAKIAQEQLKATQADIEAKKENINVDMKQVKSDQVSVPDLAQVNLAYATVAAPLAGIVSQVQVQVGGSVSSALNNTGGGTTILTLSDMSHIFVMATVDESDIRDVRIGQKVDIHADSFPREQFAGVVTVIAHEGVNTSNVVTFQVKIEVTSENKAKLKPQMTADVTIVEAQKSGALVVPVLAVYQKKHKSYVKVVKADESVEERLVELGITDEVNVEITSGLSDGEKVQVVKNDASRWAAQGVARPPGAPARPSR